MLYAVQKLVVQIMHKYFKNSFKKVFKNVNFWEAERQVKIGIIIWLGKRYIFDKSRRKPMKFLSSKNTIRKKNFIVCQNFCSRKSKCFLFFFIFFDWAIIHWRDSLNVGFFSKQKSVFFLIWFDLGETFIVFFFKRPQGTHQRKSIIISMKTHKLRW